MNLIFDFDGTICDSVDIYIKLANTFFKKIGKREITINEVKKKGTLELLKELKIKKIYLPFIVIYVRLRMAKVIPSLKPFPNLAGVLEELNKNHTLGIVTSNSTSNVRSFLKNNSLDEYFTFVYSSTNYFDKKGRIAKALREHNLEIEDSYFIGDETRDMTSAKLGGLKTIAVTWGTEGNNLLKKSKPNYMVDKPKELLSIID